MTALSKPTLIIADDNEELLQFLIDDLSENFEILKARNGKQVIELLHAHQVDLIISDIMMPEMDGYALCAALKSDLEHSHIPIILLTAKNTLEAKIEGIENGADAYVEKPFSPEFLLVQINSLLKNRQNVRNYFLNSPISHVLSIGQNTSDQAFLEKLDQLILANIQNSNLNVDKLAELLHMSRPTLYRKIKSISNLSPNDLINITRLKKAAALLLETDYKIYQISDAVGYSSATHFNRNFQKQFGMTPLEFQEKSKAN